MENDLEIVPGTTERSEKREMGLTGMKKFSKHSYGLPKILVFLDIPTTPMKGGIHDS